MVNRRDKALSILLLNDANLAMVCSQCTARVPIEPYVNFWSLHNNVEFLPASSMCFLWLVFNCIFPDKIKTFSKPTGSHLTISLVLSFRVEDR